VISTLRGVESLIVWERHRAQVADAVIEAFHGMDPPPWRHSPTLLVRVRDPAYLVHDAPRQARDHVLRRGFGRQPQEDSHEEGPPQAQRPSPLRHSPVPAAPYLATQAT
jgi:hypothetical protein